MCYETWYQSGDFTASSAAGTDWASAMALRCSRAAADVLQLCCLISHLVIYFCHETKIPPHHCLDKIATHHADGLYLSPYYIKHMFQSHSARGGISTKLWLSCCYHTMRVPAFILLWSWTVDCSCIPHWGVKMWVHLYRWCSRVGLLASAIFGEFYLSNSTSQTLWKLKMGYE